MGRPWAGHEQGMSRAWTEHGQGMGKAWAGHGQGMGKAWAGHGQGMGRAWERHGQGIGRAWAAHVLGVLFAWFTHNKSGLGLFFGFFHSSVSTKQMRVFLNYHIIFVGSAHIFLPDSHMAAPEEAFFWLFPLFRFDEANTCFFKLVNYFYSIHT